MGAGDSRDSTKSSTKNESKDTPKESPTSSPKSFAKDSPKGFPKGFRKGFNDHYVRTYGDLLFDLCEAVLWNPLPCSNCFSLYSEKSTFRFAISHLLDLRTELGSEDCLQATAPFLQRYGYQVSPDEQIRLDANESVSTRLKQFGSYFHRLNAEDQLLLLLKDKYGIPYFEIANAMGTPEGTLKVRRQQALRTLEEWLWNSR